MSYKKCLELANAKVLTFESFGSYQGDWWAKVSYNDKIGWIHGWFGSCSGCDAFQAEFGCESHEHEDDDCISYYDFPEKFKEDCPHCQDLMKRMKEFGEKYLDDLYTQEEAESKGSENLDWDGNTQEMLDFIRNNKI